VAAPLRARLKLMRFGLRLLWNCLYFVAQALFTPERRLPIGIEEHPRWVPLVREPFAWGAHPLARMAIWKCQRAVLLNRPDYKKKSQGTQVPPVKGSWSYPLDSILGWDRLIKFQIWFSACRALCEWREFTTSL
jgi:hypothetical protein